MKFWSREKKFSSSYLSSSFRGFTVIKSWFSIRTVVINIIIYHLGWRTLSLRMPKLQENFTTVIVCHRYERLAVFAICFRHYFALSKWRRWKTSVSDLKNAQTSPNSPTIKRTRQVCASAVFLFWSLYKTNRFHITVGLFSNRSQTETSKCGENISDTLASGSPRVPFLCFYHILTSSMIYYWTDVGQHENYLLKQPACSSLAA